MNAAIQPPENVQYAPASASWNAYLKLRFAKRQRGVRLVGSEHEGPLYVQKAFYPEGDDCAHCYLLHPPGGLVTGDQLTISIQAEPASRALITTPGAGRVYKARDRQGVQTQTIHLQVDEQASLEWMPLETILFPNSQARLNTRIDLADQAKVIAWDITCFGLPANRIEFSEGSVRQSLQVWVKGRIQLNERLVIDSGTLASENNDTSLLKSKAGFCSRPVHGLLIAGPFEQEAPELVGLINQLRELKVRQREGQSSDLVSVTQIGAFLSVRYLGWCTESARTYFTGVWQILRPCLLDRKAVSPRIWAT